MCLPSTLLGFLLFLRLLFRAGLTQGLSGLPLLLRNFFLMLDSELWEPKGRQEMLSRGPRARVLPSCFLGTRNSYSTLTLQLEGHLPFETLLWVPFTKTPRLFPKCTLGSGGLPARPRARSTNMDGGSPVSLAQRECTRKPHAGALRLRETASQQRGVHSAQEARASRAYGRARTRRVPAVRAF